MMVTSKLDTAARRQKCKDIPGTVCRVTREKQCRDIREARSRGSGSGHDPIDCRASDRCAPRYRP